MNQALVYQLQHKPGLETVLSTSVLIAVIYANGITNTDLQIGCIVVLMAMYQDVLNIGVLIFVENVKKDMD